MKNRKQTKQTFLLWIVIVLMLLGGCAAPVNTQSGNNLATPKPIGSPTSQLSGTTEVPGVVLADGVYSAEFITDSSMFHVNEANEGKGVLTVVDGKMTLHVSLASKKILNLFVGAAKNAQKEGAVLLEPTLDNVTYSDGATEEVYGYDIPVPAIDEGFALALVGTKGTWYDHTVSVSNPVSIQ